MFKDFHLKSKCLLAVITVAGAALWTSCSDDNNVTPPPPEPQVKTPHVELEEGTATPTTLSFTATSADAEKCAYLVIPASDDAPAAEAILQQGGGSSPISA